MQSIAMLYCYVYYCMVRLQSALGANDTPDVRYRAIMLMAMMEAAWFMNVVLGVKIYIDVDIVSRQPLAILGLVCLAIFVLNKVCLSVAGGSRRFELLFRSWPAHRRSRRDLYVLLFVRLLLRLCFI